MVNSLYRSRNKRLFSKISPNMKIILIVVLSILVFSFAYMTWGVEVHNKYGNYATNVGVANQSRKMYAIMFDAGSTGSRIHAYRFVKTIDGAIKLEDELFEFVKPGLSSYADSPKAAAESLHVLMEQAKKYIPQSEWSQTPIALKATAGLRLISENKANAILAEVRTYLNSQNFKTVPNNVEIIGGTDEGVYSWFTINFLHGALQNMEMTKGVIDLGGGSVQITFVPQLEQTLQTSLKEHIHVISVMKHSVSMYTHSYLGLGLMSARLQIMGRDDNDKSPSLELTTNCFPPGFTRDWKHQGQTFKVSGKDTSSFSICYDIAKAVVEKHTVFSPEEIRNKPFHLISYFYDKAADAKLIDFELGGELKVQDFFTAGEKFCSKHDRAEPFLCMDLSFMSALLHHGFGFSKENSLVLKKKINGIETSWTLGAAYQLL